jgi:hypothetical protein
MSSGQTVAALGNTWAHAITTRFVLRRHTKETSHERLYTIYIEKSPLAPQDTFYYTITKSGFTQVVI